ncbi:2OG-Fe(II) oxygenase [Undibacterium sp. JH2W]|uniref:2OG-Fe(II) oxygenase n=1 Tax=Undibacterium sp. JH2W TaxID=3413037 RepID=UPI003BEFBC0B
MELNNYGAGVFGIKNFITEEECERMIFSSEQMGYEEAMIQTGTGMRMYKDVRNNDRVIFDDKPLAAAIFERAKLFLPAELKEWTLLGLNERFRFYRYEEGQYFKWHKDGNYARNEDEVSFLTLLIYLNGDYTGGSTSFRWETIQPEKGMALVFPHMMLHQGAPVESGVKYVLRTDVMYKKAPGSEIHAA